MATITHGAYYLAVCSSRNLSFALLIVATFLATVDAEASRPNFILLLTDDQAWDAHGVLEPLVETPNLEELAASATYFSNGFVSTSICPASRASILTGLYYPGHGYTFERPPLGLPLLSASWPALLRQAGYRLAFLGKNGLRLDAERLDLLFDEWETFSREYFVEDPPGEEIHLTDLLASRATEFLARQTPATPFGLVVWFHAPHAINGTTARAFPPPRRYEELYDDVVFPPRPGSEPSEWGGRPQFFEEGLNREQGELWWSALYQENLRDYHAMIRGIDDALGAIRSTLTEVGLERQTVILYLSDNGFFRGERLFGGKWLGHDASIRVPFLILDPSRRPRTVDQLAVNVDIAPTVLDMAGLPIPDSMQGRSLVPLLENAGSSWRDDFFLEHSYVPANRPEILRFRGVRTTRWKYLGYLDHDYEELYDLDLDPNELTNFADHPAYAGIKEALRTRTEELYSLYARFLFGDGFESGNTSAWSSSGPP